MIASEEFKRRRIFEDWDVAFHGTKKDTAVEILQPTRMVHKRMVHKRGIQAGSDRHRRGEAEGRCSNAHHQRCARRGLYILAMVQPSSTVLEAECLLSDAQLAALQMSATAILGLNEANVTCGYNMTLSSILGGTTIGV
jgi:hypothetical protein